MRVVPERRLQQRELLRLLDGELRPAELLAQHLVQAREVRLTLEQDRMVSKRRVAEAPAGCGIDLPHRVLHAAESHLRARAEEEVVGISADLRGRCDLERAHPPDAPLELTRNMSWRTRFFASKSCSFNARFH